MPIHFSFCDDHINYTRVWVFGLQIFVAEVGRGWATTGPAYSFFRNGLALLPMCYRTQLKFQKV